MCRRCEHPMQRAALRVRSPGWRQPVVPYLLCRLLAAPNDAGAVYRRRDALRQTMNGERIAKAHLLVRHRCRSSFRASGPAAQDLDRTSSLGTQYTAPCNDAIGWLMQLADGRTSEHAGATTPGWRMRWSESSISSAPHHPPRSRRGRTTWVRTAGAAPA